MRCDHETRVEGCKHCEAVFKNAAYRAHLGLDLATWLGQPGDPKPKRGIDPNKPRGRLGTPERKR